MSSDAATTHSHLHVDVVLYPGVMVGWALAFVDLIQAVNTIAELQSGRAAQLISWQLVDERLQRLDHKQGGSFGPLLAPYLSGTKPDLEGGADARPVQACFLASFSAHNGPALREVVGKLNLTDAIERRLLHDGRCLTLGNSAWLVGGSRLSHDRTFALPWFFAKLFADDFTHVQVAQDSPVVTDGPFLSAAHSESMAELLIQLISTCYSTGFVQTVRAALQFDSSRQIAAAKAARDHLTRPTRDSVLALAVRWLDQNLDQPYNAEQLALACKVSHRTLHRHFQDVMQLTPLQYLNRLRCARACHLLETTIESILTIALACGYANLSGFSKMFTKEVGCPPRVYRSQRSLRAPRNRWKVELSSAKAP